MLYSIIISTETYLESRKKGYKKEKFGEKLEKLNELSGMIKEWEEKVVPEFLRGYA